MASYLDYIRAVDAQRTGSVPPTATTQTPGQTTPAGIAPPKARIQSAGSPPVNQTGGGGCGNKEILLGNLPFDFLQPPMRAQVVQLGNGGPYVIRSNPIGAIVDAVRGFCFPVPMMEQGGTYEDLSGMGLGSPGADSSALPGPAEGTPFIGGFGAGPQAQPSGAITCGTGTVYDPNIMSCVPQSAAGFDLMPTFCGQDALDMAAQKLNTAAASCDLVGIQSVRLQANSCSAVAPKAIKPQWAALVNVAKNTESNYRKQCAMARKMSATATIAALGRPERAQLTPSRRSTPVQRIPQATRQSMRQGVNTPSPLSLTESTPRFQTAREPMGGSFDPSRIRQRSSNRGNVLQYLRRLVTGQP